MFKNFEKSVYKNSTYSSRFLEISTGKFFSKLLRKSCSIPKMESSHLPAIITYVAVKKKKKKEVNQML